MYTNYAKSTNENRSSFTLIELLVVLALVAILSVVVVMTLNPAELLKQARDSNRLSDLATINTALNLFSTDVIGGFMGTSTVVYVSLPSTTSTCSNLGLPTLPSGYTYNCVTNQNLRNTDGTGWIPVNFQRISSNSPISQLPIDPTNTTSTRLYYTYIPGGSWELNATVEASKNKLGGSNDLTSKDGGSSPSQYEIGNNLNLSPIETGDSSLVGYWNFEEGPNATSTDRSGYGNHGTWYGTSTQSEHYAAGKVGQYAGSFNGSSDYLAGGHDSTLNILNNFTWSGWYKKNTANGVARIMQKGSPGVAGTEILEYVPPQYYWKTTKFGVMDIYSGSAPQDTNWHQVVAVFSSSGGVSTYVDGNFNGNVNNTANLNSHLSSNLNLGLVEGLYHSGLLDDVRIYNRVLSVAEILALYSATK